MKIKNIIFSIGAAVLLVVLSFSSMVTASESDMRKYNQLQSELASFENDHEEEIREIDAFLSSCLEEDEYISMPPEILDLTNTLSGEMQQIFLAYKIPGQQYIGYNSWWETENKLPLEPIKHPDWLYDGDGVTMNKIFTWAFLDIILAGTHIWALLMLFLISLIPWIGPELVLAILAFIQAHHAEWVDWAEQIYENQRYGIALFCFDPDGTNLRIFNKYYYCLQSNQPWTDPNIMLEDLDPIYQEYIWNKILG